MSENIILLNVSQGQTENQIRNIASTMILFIGLVCNVMLADNRIIIIYFTILQCMIWIFTQFFGNSCFSFYWRFYSMCIYLYLISKLYQIISRSVAAVVVLGKNIWEGAWPLIIWEATTAKRN